MVDVLILLSWYLKKFHFEVTYLIIHLLKVLLHSFFLAVIVAINLTGHYLGITVSYLQLLALWRDPVPLLKLVLCLVIGRKEIKTDHAFDLILFQAVEYHTSSACLLVGRFVHMDA